MQNFTIQVLRIGEVLHRFVSTFWSITQLKSEQNGATLKLCSVWKEISLGQFSTIAKKN